MNMMRHTNTLGIIEVDSTVWKKLTAEEKARIEQICNTPCVSYTNLA